MTLPGTALERGRVLPGVRVGADGWTPWRLRGRAPQVLAFLHPDCPPCEAWSRDLAAADLSTARAFAVMERAGPSALPVLVDTGGRARERLLGAGGELPTIVVADRHAAAWESYVGAGHDLPSAGEIVATLRHAEITCADCAAPGWGS